MPHRESGPTQPNIDVVIYADGGCRGNPGIGGWGVLLIHPPTLTTLERAGAVAESTNNRMEMTAAIEGLRALKSPRGTVLMITDSRYLIDACTKWMPGWKRQSWTRKDGPLKNVDLLQELDALSQPLEIYWQWVRGHTGVPGNERTDALANLAMDRIKRGESPIHEQRGHWTSPVHP